MATTPSNAPTQAEFAELLARCARGDAAALERLYRRASPVLFGCLIRILRRRAVAEEALQDAFVSIWQRSAQYQPQLGNALGWMVAIARNRAIDLLRRERNAPISVPELPEEESNTQATDEPTMLSGDALERCLKRLSGEQQRCLEFAYVSGRSHEEIAGLTGSPIGTVKSWIRRGLFALRECLES
jgi:RNA polymerase sigma-70 factor, ECF subfamily